MSALGLFFQNARWNCPICFSISKVRVALRLSIAVLCLGGLHAELENLEAQSFTTIYSFSAASMTNADGAVPVCTLRLADGTLYGTTSEGGATGRGTVFKMNIDGTRFATLHHFSSAPDGQPINDDGVSPLAGVVLSGDTLYGTASSGGPGANGTIFSLTTNGENFRTLYGFTRSPPAATNSDGAEPVTELALSSNVLYGATFGGGPTRNGVVFMVNTDGSNFATFNGLTNAGGAEPGGGFVILSNALYGTTYGGGDFGSGTVFRINLDGTDLRTLYSFTGPYDGARPWAGLCQSSNILYGTTSGGGKYGQGTVFKINPDGSGFATIHTFVDAEGFPKGGALVSLDGLLFGMTSVFFPQGGTVYVVRVDGTGFEVLHTFSGGADGGHPFGGLTMGGRDLYGTTSVGGMGANGTVFSLSLLPRLSIALSGANVTLMWPTNYAGVDYGGFTLQSATSIESPNWTPVSETPAVNNGQYMLTNRISGPQAFYRLVH